MYLKKIKKLPFFFLYLLFIFSTVILPFYSIDYLFLQTITIINWQLNSNRCLLTQIEDYLFKQTIIEYYYHVILDKKKHIHNKFLVPRSQRSCIYILFYINLLRLIILTHNL